MSEEDFSIVESDDGSHTLYSKKFKDSYHSTHGALRESQLIYIDYGLTKKSETEGNINLLELGFGTGLNLKLTMEFSREHPQTSINYHTIEAYPVPDEILQQLNHDKFGMEEDFGRMHSLPWNVERQLLNNLKVTKFHYQFEDLSLQSRQYDLIYFDAFAPSKQPHLWEEPFLQKIAEATKKGGVLVTYCSQGKFRRSLEQLGFEVERLAGPPGKREVIRATKK